MRSWYNYTEKHKKRAIIHSIVFHTSESRMFICFNPYEMEHYLPLFRFAHSVHSDKTPTLDRLTIVS